MIDLGPLLATTALWTLGAMLALWTTSLALRDASIVDVWWGPGFALIATVAFVATGGDDPRRVLLLSMALLWGLRLGGYLLWRNAGKGEDPRYVAMRRHHGARFPWVSLYTVFGFQGLMMWIVSLPLQIGQWQAGEPLGLGAALGVVLFATGLFFEAVGDWQLARFRADPASADQVMDRGLWRYTRHPNYFGDFCVWWGIYLVAAGAPWGWITVVSPALMSFLLLRVSGVAMLERSIGKRRPGYEEYVRRTSAFFPRPPRDA